MPDDEEDEEALWNEATQDVKPLPGRRSKKTAAKQRPTAKGLSVAGPLPAVSVGRAPKKAPGGAGLDRSTEEKLRRGKMPIEARLDMHGMTQDEAKTALEGFILRSYESGRRCVLVITGKGRGGEGVLKAATPGWLAGSKLQGLILKTVTAKPQHGGNGAMYILLRRKR